MHAIDQMPTTAAENNLIKRCLDKDRSAQKELYDRYAAAMFAVAMRYAKSDQEAEDILQDAFNGLGISFPPFCDLGSAAHDTGRALV